MFDFWKKRDTNLNDDEFSGIDDFDFNDFGFEATPVPEDRSPVTSVTKGVVSGGLGVFKDADIEDSVRRALPEEYGVIFDTKNHLKDSYKEVVDKAVKEFQPYKEDIKRLTQRALSATEGMLPERLYAKLSDLAKTDSKPNKESREARERAGIEAELASLFETQIKVDQEKEKRESKKEDIKGVIEHDRHRDIFSQLDAIRRSAISLSDYQDNVLIKYQRKHLENELKQTNILLRIAEETSAFRTESKTVLDQISKNTGLPDYVKLLGSERFKQTVAQRFYDGALDRFERSDNFVSNLIREAKEGASGWISGFANAIGSVVSTASMADMSDLDMGDLGGEANKWETSGNFAGMYIGEWIRNKSLDKIRDFISGKTEIKGKKFPWADQVNKGGQDAQTIISNLPYYLNQFINDHSDTRSSIVNGTMDIASRLLKNATTERKHALSNLLSEKDLHSPGIFTNRVSVSITDIIPGYLAKILREITVLRTGDNTTKELLFDYKTAKFNTSRNIGNRILNDIVTKGSRETFRRRATSNLKYIDTNNEIADEDRIAIARLFSKSIGKKDILFNKDFLTNPKTYEKIFDPEKASKIASIMGEYLKDDNGEKVNEIIYRYSKVLPNITNAKGYSQLMFDSGHRDALLSSGIINDKNQIDTDFLFNYLTGNTELTDDEITNRENSDRITLNRGDSDTPRPRDDNPLIQDRDNTLDIVRNDYLSKMLEQMKECCDVDERKEFRSSLMERMDLLQNTLLTNNQALIEAIVGIGQIQINQNTINNDRNVNVNLDGLIGKLLKGTGRLTKRATDLYVKGLGLYAKGLGRASILTRDIVSKTTVATNNVLTNVRSRFEAMDVYVRGETLPRLRKNVMEMGGYFNEDGTVIKTFNDIKGTVLDNAGNVVMTLEDFKYASVIDRSKGALVSLKEIVGSGLSIFQKGVSFAANKTLGFYGTAFDIGKKVLNEVAGEILANIDMAHDVYVKGSDTPALLRKKMLKGDYLDLETLDKITKVSDIKGTVIDEYNNVVLTEDDIRLGLVDNRGREFKGLLTFAIEKTRKLARYGVIQARRAIRSASKLGKRLVNKTGNFFKKFSLENIPDVDIQIGSSLETVSILENIYLLLDKRLPGNTRLGDTDGDGDIENSVADIIQKRRRERENAKKKGTTSDLANAKDTEERGRGLFGFLWDKVKGAGLAVGGMLTAGLVTGGRMLGKLLLSTFFKGGKVIGSAIGKALMSIPGLGKILGGGVGMAGSLFGKTKAGAAKLGRSLLKSKSKLALGAGALLGLFGLSNSANAEEVEPGQEHLSDYDYSEDTGFTGDLLETGTMAYSGLAGMKAASVAKAGGRVGGRFFAPLAVGLDGYEAFKGFQTGDTSRQIQGTMGVTGAGIGAAVGSLFFGIGAVPGAMIGSALGWLTGKITNSVRKFIKKGKLTPMEEVRFVQYGFDPKRDKDKIDQILNVEKILEEGLVLKGTKYDIDLEKVSGKADILSIFNITQNSTQQEYANIERFIVTRVIPVLTANVLALRTVAPDKVIEYMDRISDLDKIKVIAALRALSPSTYSHVSPVFVDGNKLLNAKEVATYLEKKEFELKEKYKKETLKDNDGFFSSPWFESDSEYKERKRKEEEELNKEINNATNQNNVLTNITTNIEGANTGNISVSTSDDLLKKGFVSPDGSIKLDALTCVRFIAYGLKDLTDVTKITQLRKLEEFMAQANMVALDVNGSAKFSGGENNVVGRMAHILNQKPVMNRGLRLWVINRFIPVYLRFRSALAYVGIKVPDYKLIKALKYGKQLVVANSILAAVQGDTAKHTSMYEGGNSIFEVKETPWQGFEPSDSASYAKEYLNYLEIKAKEDTKVETEKATDTEKEQAINRVTPPTTPTTTPPSASTSSDVSGSTGSSSVPSTPLMMQSASNQFSSDVSSTGTSSGNDTTSYIPGTGMAPLARPTYDSSNLDFSNNDSNIAGIAKAMLEKVGADRGDIDKYLPVLTYTLQKYDITKREHIAAFIAQVIAESRFKPIREQLNYKSADSFYKMFRKHITPEQARQLTSMPSGPEKDRAIANAVYGHRMGNQKGSNDGYLYRGGGFIQLTGKNNYAAFAKSSGIDVVKNPDLITDPNVAMLAAGHFWQSNNLNSVFDSGGMKALSKRVNGGDNGLNHRIDAFSKAIQVHTASPVTVSKPQLSSIAPTKTSTPSDSSNRLAGIDINIPGTSTDSNSGFIKASAGNMSPVSPMTTGSSLNTGMDVSNYQVNNGIATATVPIDTSQMDVSSSSTGYGGSVMGRNAITSPRTNASGFVDNDSGNQDTVLSSTSSSKAAKAAKYARSNAKPKSIGKCAMYVRLALEHAGYKFERKGSAYQYTDVLTTIGWTKLPNNTPYQIGDIIIFGNNNAHPHGHIQIYDGSNWISDFIQKNVIPYKNKSSAGEMSLWRDTSSVPSSKEEVNSRITNNTGNTRSVEQEIRGQATEVESTPIVNDNTENRPPADDNYSIPEKIELEKPVLTSSPITPPVDRRNISNMRGDEQRMQMNILTESVSIAKEHLGISKEQLVVLKQLLEKIGTVQTNTNQNTAPDIYREPKELTASNTPINKQPMVDTPKVALGVTRSRV